MTFSFEKVLALLVAMNTFRKFPDQGADIPAWVSFDSSLEGVNGHFFANRKMVSIPDHTLSVERC